MPDFDSQELDVFERSTNNRAHPSLELLQAHGQDVLPAAAEQRVGEHLAGCALCRQLIADMDTLPEPQLGELASARIRSTIPVSGQSTQRRYRPALAVAAMAVVGVSLFGAYHLLHDDLTPKITSATQPATKAIPAPQVAQVEAPRLAVMEKLAPPQTLDLTTRGAHTGPTTEEMLPAFRAYNRNEFSAAQVGFAALHRQYPQAQIPALYLGVTSLLLNQNEAAAVALRDAQATAPSPRPTAASQATAWYSAVAAQRLRRPSAAAQFADICRSSGPYAARACDLAK